MSTLLKPILFRCDAGDNTGGGHLIRCLAFATSLERQGFKCFFLCNEQAWDFPALKNSGFKKISKNDLSQYSFSYGIIDHYGLDTEYEKTIKPFCDLLIVIDDLANRRHDCDILIDFSPSRKKSDYLGLVPKHCKLCIGIDYLILRPEFFIKDNTSDRHPCASKIFITMGSIDGASMLPPTLDFLEKYNNILEIHILVTQKTKTLSYVKSAVKTSKHTIHLHIDIDNPVDIMRDCCLAISAGGMTCLELVALQIPTLAIIVAENQRANVEYLNDRDYVKNIKDITVLETSDLHYFLTKHTFKKLQTNKTLKIISELA